MKEFIKHVESFFKTEVILSKFSDEVSDYDVLDLGWNKILICHASGFVYRTKHIERRPYIGDAILSELYLYCITNEQED